MLGEKSVAHRSWKIDTRFWRVFRATSRYTITAVLLMVVYALPALAQPKKGFTLNDIRDLTKNGVSPNRIAQLVEERGVEFELDDRALRRLKQDGANDRVLSAVKKMSARYVEERRSHGLQEGTRKPEKSRTIEETSRPKTQEAKTQPAGKKVEQARGRVQEATKQGSQRVNLLSREDVGRVASLHNVMSTEEGEVSGELINHSKQTLREVRLQILYSWRWKNEHRPGPDDPGRATYYVLDKEIPPGQTVRFNYKPSPPLPAREDGQFDISVKVAGFAQVFPGAAAR
jgi:hypothetical protein